MPNFNLEKGSKYVFDKGITNISLRLSWDAPEKINGVTFDPDASVFGLSHLADGTPKFYNDGSHAVFYGNTDLKKPDGHFETADKSITHSGDNRVGGEERIDVDFPKLPVDIAELASWITIDKAIKRKQTFGVITNCKVIITDNSTGENLCEYRLKDEFKDATAVQVGSFFKNEDRNWEFQAMGQGAPVEINQIVERYS